MLRVLCVFLSAVNASALVLRSTALATRPLRTAHAQSAENPPPQMSADYSRMRLGECLFYLTERSAPGSTDERIAALQANGCPQSVLDSVLKNTDLERYRESGATAEVIGGVMKTTALEHGSVDNVGGEGEAPGSDGEEAAPASAGLRAQYTGRALRGEEKKLTAEEAAAQQALGQVLKRLPTKWGETMEGRYERARAQMAKEAVKATQREEKLAKLRSQPAPSSDVNAVVAKLAAQRQ